MTIPTGRRSTSLSTMGTAPTSRFRITIAARWAGSSGVQHAGLGVMMSRTFIEWPSGRAADTAPSGRIRSPARVGGRAYWVLGGLPGCVALGGVAPGEGAPGAGGRVGATALSFSSAGITSIDFARFFPSRLS